MPPRANTRGSRARGRGGSRAAATSSSPGETFPNPSPTPSEHEIDAASGPTLPPAAAAASPLKRRRGKNQAVNINKLTDLEAWSYEDQVLIGKPIIYSALY